jgi:hypothetical protein
MGHAPGASKRRRVPDYDAGRSPAAAAAAELPMYSAAWSVSMAVTIPIG